MTRLRFIRPWSTYRVGDTMDTESWTTVCRLVTTHGVAQIEPVGATLFGSSAIASQVTLDSPLVPDVKAIDEAPADKMVRAAGKAKMRRSASKGLK
jgi:hypothetical protein